MALRKALAYSKKKARPFTRISSNKSKAYIKTVPQNKVVKFHQGAQADYQAGKHPYTIKLIAEEYSLIRDNAIESARMYLTKKLDSAALGQYYLAIKVFPHHIIRENKLASGAGADRLSQGMSQAYGVVIGRGAFVNKGKEIFRVSAANEKIAKIARDLLNEVKAKLPCACRVIFEKTKNS